MGRVGIAAALLVGGTLSAAGGHAQTVEGRVLDGNGQPVGAALVVLTDEQGETVRAVLSRADGVYTIAAGRPGRFRLRVERIGLEPHASDAFDLGWDERRWYPVTVPVAPIVLGEIRADATRRCPVRPEQGAAIGGFWDAARRTLQLAATLDPLGEPLGLRAIHYLREMDRSGARQVAVHAVQELDLQGRLPFGAISERLLAAGGFAFAAGDGHDAYFSPSPAALLSYTFLETHCFNRIAERGELIGLGFEPGQRLERVGIRGTLWLERGSLEVRSIEFDYRDPATGQPNGASGRVDLARLANGASVVERWWIRLPYRIELPAPSDSLGRVTILGYSEEGGVVLRSSGTPFAGSDGDILRAMAEEPVLDAEPLDPLAAAGVAVVMRARLRESYTVAEPAIRASLTTLGELEIETWYGTATSMLDMLSRRYSSLVAADGRLYVRAFHGSGCDEPHYRVNGVPVLPQWALGLNPRDVSNVRVLRYGAETALYGFLGACGVIEITTR